MLRNGKSVIAIADTHFGSRNEIIFEPEILSGFLNWVKLLEKGKVDPLKLGDWNPKKNEIELKPPEKIILLGDILELWDASDRSVDACVRSFTQLFSKLDCEKIYVLGNHDDVLEEITTNREHQYPVGASGLRILKEFYPDQNDSENKQEKVETLNVGNEKYLFIHGHQFDKYFIGVGRLYRIIPYMREAAMAFGHFTWIFVVLFIVGIVLWLLRWFSPSFWMLTLFGLLAVPRIFISIARPFFNGLKTTKYEPLRLNLTRFEKWWRKFSKGKKYPMKNLNIVYGHSHVIDVIDDNRLKNIKLFNLPAWVKDLGSKGKRENVLRAVFLYIDKDGCKFLGWNWDKSMPFFIPEEVIEIRRRGSAITRKYKERLRDIGWPKKLLRKWEEKLPINELKRTRQEAIVQEMLK